MFLAIYHFYSLSKHVRLRAWCEATKKFETVVQRIFRDELNPVYQMAVNNGYTLYCQRSKEMIYRHEIGHKHEIGRKS
jgi:hypothetical protein